MTGGPDGGVDVHAVHSRVTDPGRHRECLAGLPARVPDLVRAVQGLLLHAHWARRYGVKPDESRLAEVSLRWVRRMLAQVLSLDRSPLSVPRPPDLRLLGTCRDFAVLTVAALREAGVPARVRCGFATYFTPGKYEDHWVAEYRSGGRWIAVDAQLDATQMAVLGIGFDPLDVAGDRFIGAGRAWEMCRLEGAEPGDFGIFDMRGLWFVGGNVVRDVLALAGIELLPWDSWGPMIGPGEKPGGGWLATIDRLATLAEIAREEPGTAREAVAMETELAPPSWWDDEVLTN